MVLGVKERPGIDHPYFDVQMGDCCTWVGSDHQNIIDVYFCTNTGRISIWDDDSSPNVIAYNDLRGMIYGGETGALYEAGWYITKEWLKAQVIDHVENLNKEV